MCAFCAYTIFVVRVRGRVWFNFDPTADCMHKPLGVSLFSCTGRFHLLAVDRMFALEKSGITAETHETGGRCMGVSSTSLAGESALVLHDTRWDIRLSG